MSAGNMLYSLHQVSEMHEDKLQALIELIRMNPSVRSCVHRMICEVNLGEIIIKEKNKVLKSLFKQEIVRLKPFLRCQKKEREKKRKVHIICLTFFFGRVNSIGSVKILEI